MVDKENNSIDVTPNPRILQMLGEIAFDPWQCIAELIDNSLDAYFTAVADQPTWLSEAGLESYKIDIQAPTKHEFQSGLAVLSVSDTGRGMDRDQVAKAVTAGFSGNAPLEKLGLFGMGFNIATARLGRMTRIKTTRAGDTDWLVLELDLDKMRDTGKFHAPISYEHKDDDSYHGTIIEILRLKQEFQGQLTSGFGISHIKKQLSRIYSAILGEQPVEIQFGEHALYPWKHCTWDKGRTAIVGSGREVPAFIQIDHELPDYFFCSICWHWSSPASVQDENVCPACGAEGSVGMKPRKITGWLGIQRYFDFEHYGIDFARNGRIIEQLNKDSFYWNENGNIEKEYPIDGHWGGRIVGQISIDFAQVDYQKTSFSKDRNEWKEVLDYLRGSSPLRPKIGEQRGYAENTSPMARLYSTFRASNKTGRRMLVPGKLNAPKSGDNTDATAWKERFDQGDPDFQTDDKWWERVMLSAEAHRTRDQPEVDDDPDVEDPFDEDEDAPGDDSSDSETEFLVIDKSLSQRYEFPDSNVPMSPTEVTVYEDTRDLRVRDLKGRPPFEVDSRKAPNRYTLTYHKKHPAFSEFAETPQDYLLLEIAHWLSTRQGGGEWTAGRVYKKLKDEHQRSQKLDLRSLGASAGDLLIDLKEYLADCEIAKEKSDVTDALMRELTSDVMSTEGDVSVVDHLLASGKWIERVSDDYMLPIIEENPSLIMDGNFFKTSYAPITLEDIKRETAERTASCIRDIIMIKKISERSSTPDKSLLLRANAAINYLSEQQA